jgi:RNA-directed DNA polymerase
MLVIEPTNGRELPHCSQSNWTAVEANVRHLQGRIYRAAAHEDHTQVQNLQKLMVRSMSAKLKAIRQVTQENSGKQTPGIDGVVCDTPQTRLALLQDGLSLKGYRPKPVKRCYIPKRSGGQRPLGIPTQKDRVMQALVKLALEPEWESRLEANSCGFRPGRRTMDAITALHTCMNRQGASQWVLDADIKGCVDNIDQAALLKRLPVFTTTIRRWLKAGVVERGRYINTETGTPQGGVASPLLANIALDGMERLFDGEDPKGNPQRPSWKTGQNKGISLIRYADDLVVVAPSRTVLAQHVLPTLARFLAEGGLHLSEAKTHIVHSTEGFNFLGFEIRRFPWALLTQPQKAKMLGHYRAITTDLHRHKQSPAVQIIHENAGLGQLLPTLRRPKGLQKAGPFSLACAVAMGQTSTSQQVSAMGQPTVLPYRRLPPGCLRASQGANPLVSRHPDHPIPQGPWEIVADEPSPAGILGTTGTMAPEDPDHQTTEKEPPASPGLSGWTMPGAFRRRRSHRRSPHHPQTRGW